MTPAQQNKLMQDIAKIANQLDDIVCNNCGSSIILPVFVGKRLPRLHPINPAAQDITVQVPAGNACFVCGQRNSFTKLRKVGEVKDAKISEKESEDN